jgi:hypothetical protein
MAWVATADEATAAAIKTQAKSLFIHSPFSPDTIGMPRGSQTIAQRGLAALSTLLEHDDVCPLAAQSESGHLSALALNGSEANDQTAVVRWHTN